MKHWQIVAAAGGLLWLLIGAATGHHPLPAQEALWLEKAQRYHIVHVLALLWLSSQARPRSAVALLWTVGTVLFSGALYLMVLTALPLNYVVPLGGTAMLGGWAWLLWRLIREK